MADRLALLMNPGASHADLAKRSRLDELDRLFDVIHAPALRAELHDALVFPRGLDRPTAFDDVVARRFLAINILAGLAARSR